MARAWGICPSSGSYMWVLEVGGQKSKNSNARGAARRGRGGTLRLQIDRCDIPRVAGGGTAVIFCGNLN